MTQYKCNKETKIEQQNSGLYTQVKLYQAHRTGSKCANLRTMYLLSLGSESQHKLNRECTSVSFYHKKNYN